MGAASSDAGHPTVLGERVTSGGNEYAIAERGAHVTRWRSARFGDLLYLSSAARSGPGTAIRGGVPICFPWFANGVDGSLSPSHGLLRTATWRRTDWRLNERQSVLTAVYEIDERQLSGSAGSERFAHRFTARYDVALAPGHARFTLRITNDGAEPFTFGAALHSYFAVSDVETVRVSGLNGAPYADKVTGRRATQSGDVALDGEVDRVYDSSADVLIADDEQARTIRVGKLGAPQTVVWNPGAARAQTIADLGSGEWRRFVCVEAALLESEPLYPGERHELEQQVFVSDG